MPDFSVEELKDEKERLIKEIDASLAPKDDIADDGEESADDADVENKPGKEEEKTPDELKRAYDFAESMATMNKQLMTRIQELEIRDITAKQSETLKDELEEAIAEDMKFFEDNFTDGDKLAQGFKRMAENITKKFLRGTAKEADVRQVITSVEQAKMAAFNQIAKKSIPILDELPAGQTAASKKFIEYARTTKAYGHPLAEHFSHAWGNGDMDTMVKIYNEYENREGKAGDIRTEVRSPIKSKGTAQIGEKKKYTVEEYQKAFNAGMSREKLDEIRRNLVINTDR